MAALQCEICGGKLIGKPGGVFECDSCGMEYSTEWAKAKVQEIKGTVKIEGPVEVTGTVKVEGGPSVENLLKRGNTLLTERKWTDAETYFNRALELEPENAEAYLGLGLVRMRCTSRDGLAKKDLRFLDRNLSRAMKIDPELKDWLGGLIEAQRKAKEAKASSMAKRDPQALIELQQKMIPLAGMIAAGRLHTVGLRADGTVAAVGSGQRGLCDVSDWRDITAVAAGSYHTVGLKADGTVVSVGDNRFGQCDVGGWTNIAAVAAGFKYTVGLRRDGTVVCTDQDIQKEVESWTDIVAVAADVIDTIGLRKNGTVVGTGHTQSRVSNWRSIAAIAKDSVGLRTNGTVVTKYDSDKEKFADWLDIVAIAVSDNHTVGLRADGTVAAVGSNEKGQCNVGDWTDIVAIAASGIHTVGLRRDGTVVAVGENESGQCGVDGWRLFQSIDTLEQERQAFAAERRRQEAERQRRKKIPALEAEKASIEAELPNIKGLFSGGKRRELEARLANIEEELKKL